MIEDVICKSREIRTISIDGEDVADKVVSEPVTHQRQLRPIR